MSERKLSRRDALKLMAAAGAVAGTGCARTDESGATAPEEGGAAPAAGAEAPSVPPDAPHPVRAVTAMGFPWQTRDPFLFCVHHDDLYPAGDERMGPATSLAGRNLGNDFTLKDGFRMYHGHHVPGFPRHPHRGFETVTLVRRGLLDHSDSLGAAARFGGGDVQWLTAGEGILHAEMFPLLDAGGPNHVELFQIWLNLPRADKMVAPHFSMLWRHTIPRHLARDEAGRITEVVVVAGRYGDARAPAPPPSSWASRPDSDVAIWTVKMEANATWTLPAAPGTHRTLYVFEGDALRAAGRPIPGYHQLDLDAGQDVELIAGAGGNEMLLLQGRPIEEPIARRGPFVMNTPDEIGRAYADYQRTQFGGWPWQDADPVHPREEGRFARHADGRVERPA